jgi:hypothetical protein
MDEGKSWGADVVPKERWIDPKKTYKTRDGKRVIGLAIQLHNANGNEVTFPVKGSIVVRTKPFKTIYAVWTLDGRHSVLKESEHDLIEQ